MSEQCENCGNPILTTDTVCWHCGYKLPKRPQEKSSPVRLPAALSRPARATGERQETAVEAYDLRAIAVYGGLTLIILVALLLVMRSLGRQPLLVASADLRLGSDWTAVTDNDLRYTLSLPPGWEWIDGAFRQQEALLNEFATKEPEIGRSLLPLGEVADDLELLAIGFLPQPPESGELRTFVVIGRSTRLSQVSPPQALDLLAEQTIAIASTAIVEPFPGQPQARFGHLDGGWQIQCRSAFIAESPAGYLLATCAPQASFGLIQRDLEEILNSFQLLQH